MTYNHLEIDKKWQDFWEENNLFKAEIDHKKEKYYILDMFPYPSGAGLHVGHPEGYTATDILARYKRMKGFNVLHPIGWDAFGLPAENYAIKTGTHPSKTTAENVANFKRQIKSIGFSYDRNREVDTTNPDYYKWTQRIFLELFKKGLAYESEMPINWCPKCKTGLANEEVVNGKCDRCDSQTNKKNLRQWVLKITDYAERLLGDLDELKDWPEPIKAMQANWIGKSEGALFKQKINGTDIEFETYNSVPQMAYADTFYVIAPDHKLMNKILDGTEGEVKIKENLEKMLNKKNIDKYEAENEIEGIFTGRYISDPLGNGDLPLWIASYAIADYGTGIVKCSAHDERDFKFAKKYNIPLKAVLVPKNEEHRKKVENCEEYYRENNGILIEPKEMIGETFSSGREKMIDYLEKKGFAKRTVNYKLRDWNFSRQRYWGEPIPLIHLEKEDVKNLEEIDDEKINKRFEKYFDIKKIRNASFDKNIKGLSPKGSLANSLQIYSIIFGSIKKVKSDFIKIQFKAYFEEFNSEIGKVIINGRFLFEHFKYKKLKEKKNRQKHLGIICENFDKIYFPEKDKGFLFINGELWVIILEKIEKNKYNLLTYYQVKSVNNFYNTSFILKETPSKNEDKRTLCKKNKTNSLIKNGEIISKIYFGKKTDIIYDKNLAVKLPNVKKYEPTGTGESPLADIDEWVNVEVASNLKGKRETNTMPQWAGSSWYYLRFMDANNPNEFVSKEAENYWGKGGVDMYVGGAEHAVLHLLYARFWHKVLFDLGVVSTKEPFKALRNQGMILAEDGRKMSKSWGNVINPDDVISEYGADTLRLYEMFMGPFEDVVKWDVKGIKGVKRFLDKVWNLRKKVEKSEKRVILIHGFTGSANNGWFPDLKTNLVSKGFYVQTPSMPNSDKPVYEEWKKVLDFLNPDENTTLIGHSLGGGFIPRYLAETGKKVGKIILVAPSNTGNIVQKGDKNFLKGDEKFYREIEENIDKNFFKNFDFEKIHNLTSEIKLFYSDTEPFILQKDFKNYEEKLDIKGICLKNLGHLSNSAKKETFEELSKLFEENNKNTNLINLQKSTHKTIKKIGQQIEDFKFNTAISDMMVLVNEMQKMEKIPANLFEDLLFILNPFAPHITEELWKNLGHLSSIVYKNWPEFNEEFCKENNAVFSVQVNGKIRGHFEAPKTLSKEDAIKKAKEIASKYLDGKTIKKEIFVPGKIASFVV